jgi:hypothetical protein
MPYQGNHLVAGDVLRFKPFRGGSTTQDHQCTVKRASPVEGRLIILPRHLEPLRCEAFDVLDLPRTGAHVLRKEDECRIPSVTYQVSCPSAKPLDHSSIVVHAQCGSHHILPERRATGPA